MDTREIFDAEPLSIFQFLSENDQGLYIPPYQRAYSWDTGKVRRMVEDINHGLRQLNELEDSICFLGTVIALRDLSYTTVEPVHRSMVPNKVMTIIDGQQRLTTLLLLITVLHEQIRQLSDRVPTDTVLGVWCRNQALQLMAQLAKTFEEDRNWGDDQLKWYPRMTRSYYDVWSRTAGIGRYMSPIGSYLHAYGTYARQSGRLNAFQPVEVAGAVDEQNADGIKYLHKVRADLRSLVKRELLAPPSIEPEDLELPTSGDIGMSPRMQRELFNTELPNDVVAELVAPTLSRQVSDLVRLVVLSQFLLQRVTLAVVTAKREDFGFDMFEALNTTGEPLTAVETFKPRAIQAEGLRDWRESPSRASFDTVEGFLQREQSADRRQTATSSLLIPFALAQSGRKLGKRLTEQRRFLRSTFDALPGLSEKRDYLRLLAQTARFLEGPWADPTILPAEAPSAEAEAASLCLAVLRSGGHDVVLAPLVRYFAAYRTASEDQADRALQLAQLLKGATAFFGLWRGAMGGTNGIDDVYRKLMSGREDQPAGLAKEGLARRSSPLDETPAVSEVLSYFRDRLLEKGLGEREAWVRQAAQVPVYTSSRALTRLLLLAASEDSLPDVNVPGLVVRGREGLLPTLSLNRWEDEAHLSIEHVAPQGGGEGWDDTLYEPMTRVHTLGNLTLLPSMTNSSVNNRPWASKRLMYQVLSAQTVEEAELLLRSASAEGLDLGSGADIVSHSKYLPLLASLGKKADVWSPAFVEERSVRLAGLAWDKLAPWLEIPSMQPSTQPHT